MNLFLRDKISYQEIYEEILKFIESVHIRSGEVDGNYYILKKINVDNFQYLLKISILMDKERYDIVCLFIKIFQLEIFKNMQKKLERKTKHVNLKMKF